jgi:hypothetical protein
MSPATRQSWKDQPEEHDYLAAEAYLQLLLPPVKAKRIVRQLRTARQASWKAKDLLRASRLPLLPSENLHVALDLQKVKTGKPLSPILLVRGDLASEMPLTVADGYHRLCASHYLDEDGDIPCRIGELGRR